MYIREDYLCSTLLLFKSYGVDGMERTIAGSDL